MTEWSTETPIDTDAVARALALCERARHAIDRSRELAARVVERQVRLAEMKADLAEARRERRAQRTAPAMPWARAARGIARAFDAGLPSPRRLLVHATSSPKGRPLHAGAASGRVVRRSPKRRGAASRQDGDDGSDGSDGEPPAPSRRSPMWAQVEVFGERVAYDTSGIEWTVRELDATEMPGSRCPRCLIFENHQVVRKVWHYPADWKQFGDAALLELSETET